MIKRQDWKERPVGVYDCAPCGKDDGGLDKGDSGGKEEVDTISRDMKEERSCHLLTRSGKVGVLGNSKFSELGSQGAGGGICQGGEHRGRAGEFGRDAPVSLP